MFGFARLMIATILAISLFACEGSALITPDSAGTDQTQTAATPPASDTPASPIEGADEPVAAPAAEQQPDDNPPPPKHYTSADITDLILVTGQSNVLGAETSYDEGLDAPHDRAFAFTDQGWRKADLHQVWDRNWFPRMHPGGIPSNNFAFHMAKQVALNEPDRVIGFIVISDPGKRIENWDIDGAFWQNIDTRVVDAINQLPQKSQLDGILWHQGESNAGESDYHTKLDALIDNFRTQNWFATDKPFICGETAVFESINRQLMNLNNNRDRWTGCVSSDNLTTQKDGYHFDGPGLRELGKRYAAKYLQMTR